jgi:predicted nucleotidyltransferase
VTNLSKGFPPVTDELLTEIVTRILSAGSAERIVLFGSRARGEARPDSDLDLLIIEESNLPRYRRAARYYLALAGAFPAKDIVVWSPHEVAEWQGVANSFVSTALREGKILYERSL